MSSPTQYLMQLITGAWQSQAVYVAAKLELADHLARGAMSSVDLAAATNSHAETLFRLLRALASIGIFRESSVGFFENTPNSEMLRKTVPGSQWAMAVMMGEEHYTAWGQLLYSLQTGRGSFAHVFGQRPFEYLAAHPDQAAVFDAAMTSVHGRETGPMIAAYDFTKTKLVADIGGGNGSVITEVLRQNPHLQGILYDLSHVVERAKANLVRDGVADRCKTIAGSFFESIPQGADVYLFRHIIHDWLDDECVTILNNCRAAMAPHSRVVIAETIVPAGNEFAFVKWLDLNMLVVPDGKERTLEEYELLFSRAGLKLSRVIHTPAEIHLIEAAIA